MKTSKKILLISIVFILAIVLIQSFDLNLLKEKVKLMGVWAPITIFALRFSSVVIPAIPSTGFSLIAGGLLGFKLGIIVICIADILSCSTSFLISRKYGIRLARSLMGHKFMQKVERISSKQLENNFFLMTGILMTGFFDFFCYGIGLTRTPFRKFLPAMLLSIIISNPPIVALGAGLLEGGKEILISSILGILILALITRITNYNLNLKG